MDLAILTSQFLGWAQPIATSFGYFGILLISFIASSSIFLPIPAFILVFAFGAVLNPLLVGLFAGIGCALGELTGYGLGMGGRKIIEKRYEKFLKKYKKWFKGKKFFYVIVLFAATPLPSDVVGIVGGMFKYEIKRFLIASFFGKFIMNTTIALGGYYGIKWVLTISGGL